MYMYVTMGTILFLEKRTRVNVYTEKPWYEDHEAVLDLSQTLQTNLLSCDRKHRKMKCSYDVSLYHVDNYKCFKSVILRCFFDLMED